MNKLLTQDGAVADAKALKANNQAVGVPALPIFDKATYDQSRSGSRTTSTSRRPR
jgi:multiple sugar transport system substrate-binding protein